MLYIPCRYRTVLAGSLTFRYLSWSKLFFRMVTACSTGVKGSEDKALYAPRLCVINGRGVCCAGHPGSSYRSVFLLDKSDTHQPTAPPATPSPPSNPQPLTAKRTQHDIALINHPKQNTFNLWHAGLTCKFITCCRETACVPLSQASIYFKETSSILERKSPWQRKLMKAVSFRLNSGNKALLCFAVPPLFHGRWHACTTFPTTLAKKRFRIFFFLKHICKTWRPNYLLRIRIG